MFDESECAQILASRASLLNTQHYKVRIKGKVEQSREGVAPSPTPWCSSYRKGSLRVTLDYGRQLFYYRFIARSFMYQLYNHLVLLHINHCRLFNAKSLLIYINSSIPNNSV